MTKNQDTPVVISRHFYAKRLTQYIVARFPPFYSNFCQSPSTRALRIIQICFSFDISFFGVITTFTYRFLWEPSSRLSLSHSWNLFFIWNLVSVPSDPSHRTRLCLTDISVSLSVGDDNLFKQQMVK